MASWVVADSGLLLATALKEPYSADAKTLFADWDGQGIRVAAPTLFRYEIVAVVRKHVYRETLTPEQGKVIRDSVLSRPVTLMMDDNLLRRGYELATQFNRPTAYDAQYLALAEQLGCDFWTIDEKLFNAVSQTLAWVHWVGNFTMP